jgi:hypothetical protein
MVSSPKGLEYKKDYAVEGQQHIQNTDAYSRQRGRPTKTRPNCQRVINIWSWAAYGARHQDLLIDWQSVAFVGELMSLVRWLLELNYCELLLLQAGSWGWGQFGNPEERERLSLEAATRQRLVKTVRDWEDAVCHTVICGVCRRVRAQSLLVVTSCKIPIDPVPNLNPA